MKTKTKCKKSHFILTVNNIERKDIPKMSNLMRCHIWKYQCGPWIEALLFQQAILEFLV
jgi:hypothetical protein